MLRNRTWIVKSHVVINLLEGGLVGTYSKACRFPTFMILSFIHCLLELIM
jgi:hypothetical protein